MCSGQKDTDAVDQAHLGLHVICLREGGRNEAFAVLAAAWDHARGAVLTQLIPCILAKVLAALCVNSPAS